MVAIRQNGVWRNITPIGIPSKTKKFRTNEESKLITQRRETGVPFALTAQEFNISDWFNIDSGKKSWELKPEYKANYEIIMDDNGKVVQIKHIDTGYISYKKKDRDGNKTIQESTYVPHDINWLPTGLLKEEYNRDLYTPREKGDKKQYEYTTKPYVSAYKEWWTTPDQIKDEQALKTAQTWKPYEAYDYEQKGSKRRYETREAIRPVNERTFSQTGLTQEEKSWDDYKKIRETSDSGKKQQEDYFLEDHTTYDSYGRPTKKIHRRDKELSRDDYSDGYQKIRGDYEDYIETYGYDDGFTTETREYKPAPKAKYTFNEGTKQETKQDAQFQKELNNARTTKEKISVLEKYGKEITATIPYTDETITGKTYAEVEKKINDYYATETAAQRNERYINLLNQGGTDLARETIYSENPNLHTNILSQTPEGRAQLAEKGVKIGVNDPITHQSRFATPDEMKEWVLYGTIDAVKASFEPAKQYITENIYNPANYAYGRIKSELPNWRKPLRWLNRESAQLVSLRDDVEGWIGRTNNYVWNWGGETEPEQDFYIAPGDRTRLEEATLHNFGMGRSQLPVQDYNSAELVTLYDISRGQEITPIQGNILMRNPNIRIPLTDTGIRVLTPEEKEIYGVSKNIEDFSFYKPSTYKEIIHVPKVWAITKPWERAGEYWQSTKDTSKQLATNEALWNMGLYTGGLAAADYATARFTKLPYGVGDIVDPFFSIPDIGKAILFPTPANVGIGVLETADLLENTIPYSAVHVDAKRMMDFKSPVYFAAPIKRGKPVDGSMEVHESIRQEFVTKDAESYDPEIKQAWEENIKELQVPADTSSVVKYDEKINNRKTVKNTIVLNQDGSYTKVRALGNKKEVIVVNPQGKGKLEIWKNDKLLHKQEIEVNSKNSQAWERTENLEPYVDNVDLKEGKLGLKGKEFAKTVVQSWNTHVQNKVNFKGWLDKEHFFSKTLDQVTKTQKRIVIPPVVKAKIFKQLENIEVNGKKLLSGYNKKLIEWEMQEYAINWNQGIDDTIVVPGLTSEHAWIPGYIEQQIKKYVPHKETRTRVTQDLHGEIPIYRKGQRINVDIQNLLKVKLNTGKLSAVHIMPYQEFRQTFGDNINGMFDTQTKTIYTHDRLTNPQLKEVLQHEYFHSKVTEAFGQKIPNWLYGKKPQIEEYFAYRYGAKPREYNVKAEELFLKQEKKDKGSKKKGKKDKDKKKGTTKKYESPLTVLDLTPESEINITRGEDIPHYANAPTTPQYRNPHTEWKVYNKLNNNIGRAFDAHNKIGEKIKRLQHQNRGQNNDQIQYLENLQSQINEQIQLQAQAQSQIQAQAQAQLQAQLNANLNANANFKGNFNYNPNFNFKYNLNADSTDKKKQKRTKGKYDSYLHKMQDPFFRITGEAKYSNILNKLLRERYGNIYA